MIPYMEDNIFHIIRKYINRCIPLVYKQLGITESTDTDFTVERPKDARHGDIASNVALVLAKVVRKHPFEVAQLIASVLQKEYCLSSLDMRPLWIQKIEVAHPGFINFYMTHTFWHDVLYNTLLAGPAYGSSTIGAGKRVNVEFVSVNPTGPLHIGHTRGAVYGDALSRLLTWCNFDVIKEYYINDAGKQIEILIDSVFIRYKQKLGIKAELSIEHYPGDYLITIAEILHTAHQDSLLHMHPAERNTLIRKVSLSKIMQCIKQDLSALDIQYDVFTSEKEDIIDKDLIENALEILKMQDLIYEGTLEKPKGKAALDWEQTKQLLLKSTAFGDDSDRTIQRKDGTYTYIASDIGYCLHKVMRGFDKMILVLGADHSGYVKRMEGVANVLGGEKQQTSILIYQLVNLLKEGKPFRMSKRTGTFITLSDVLEEVGKDALRFAFLSQKNDTALDIDLNQILEQSKDNPVFYVQYAHTRCASVIHKAHIAQIFSPKELAINLEDGELKYIRNNQHSAEQLTEILSLLTGESELSLIKEIALFPKIIESATIHYEPHRIARYLYDLANALHYAWAQGIEEPKQRFILENDRPLSQARVLLLYVTAHTIFLGLQILGVQTMIKM